MFAIQDKNTGKFFDIPDAEKLQLTLTNSLFDTEGLAGSFGYEIQLSDSPSNNLLLNFSSSPDSSHQLTQKLSVMLWLDGSPWTDAVLTIKKTTYKKSFQSFLLLGISSYFDPVLKKNLTTIEFPTEKFRLAKRLIAYPLRYDSRLKYIKIQFKTATIDYFIEIKAELDGSMPSRNSLVSQLNIAMADAYDPQPVEFIFSAHPTKTNGILVYSGIMTNSGFDIYHDPSIVFFTLHNGVYQRDPDDFTITDAFSVCALQPYLIDEYFVYNNLAGDQINKSVQEYVTAVNEDALANTGNHPFVFAPFLNSGFYAEDKTPASFDNLINATGQLGTIPIFANDLSNKNKYLISPQLRLQFLLSVIQKQFNIFDFGILTESGETDENVFFRNLAIYNTFSAHKFYQYLDPTYLLPGMDSYGPLNIKLSEDDYYLNYKFTDVANFDEYVYYSDTVPYINIAKLIDTLRHLFCLAISFNYFTKKIEFKPWKDVLKSNPIDISYLVSIDIVKEKTTYNGLSIRMTDDPNDKKLEEKFDTSKIILIETFTKQEYDEYVTAMSPLPVDGNLFINHKVYGGDDYSYNAIRIETIYYYALGKGIIEPNPIQDDWLNKLAFYIEDLGYYVLKANNFAPNLKYGLWVNRGQKFDNSYSSSSNDLLEIEIENSQFMTSSNPLDGHSTILETKQLGRSRIIYSNEYFSLNANNQGNLAPFGLRLFLYDCSRKKSGAVEEVFSRAIPLKFKGPKFLEGEHSQVPNLAIYDYWYKDFELFIKNTVPTTILLKIDNLFLRNYNDGRCYKIGSQIYLFKELRVEIPKKNLGKNQRYSAEADVYIIRNYSV